MEQRTISLNVFRYLPEQEEQPRFQSYTVPYREDWVVLDALNHIDLRLNPIVTSDKLNEVCAYTTSVCKVDEGGNVSYF